MSSEAFQFKIIFASLMPVPIIFWSQKDDHEFRGKNLSQWAAQKRKPAVRFASYKRGEQAKVSAEGKTGYFSKS
jgi:hypothetical protein